MPAVASSSAHSAPTDSLSPTGASATTHLAQPGFVYLLYVSNWYSRSECAVSSSFISSDSRGAGISRVPRAMRLFLGVDENGYACAPSRWVYMAAENPKSGVARKKVDF